MRQRPANIGSVDKIKYDILKTLADCQMRPAEIRFILPINKRRIFYNLRLLQDLGFVSRKEGNGEVLYFLSPAGAEVLNFFRRD